jgi:hypothetical protein
LTETAIAVDGIPQIPPVTGKLRVAPATSAGPPVELAGLRVSTRRHGVTV